MSYRPDADAAGRPAAIAFLFHVEIGSEAVGDFLAVQGMTRDVKPFTYPEGGRNGSPHVLIAPASYGTLVLRWGMIERDTLWRWADAVRVGGSFRRDVQIHQLTRGGEVFRSYTVVGAWPSGWEGAALDAMESRIPVESLKLVYDELRVEVSRDAR